MSHVPVTHINVKLMAEQLNLSHTQIVESLTVTIPRLRDQEANDRNLFVARRINIYARSKGMCRCYELLTDLLDETSNDLERTLAIKKLSRYFLTKEGIAEFFKQDRRSFVYGSQTVPSQAWKSFIVDDYRIFLRRLGIMQP